MHGRKRQAGLTLVELLVSMLILGFVLTLVSQAVFQVSQITRTAQNATAELTGRWAGGWTVGPVLANLVAPSEAPLGKAFEGSAVRLSGYTTLPIDGSQTGVKAFALDLVASFDGPTTTTLRASPPSVASDRPGSDTVARFAGRAEFAYLDATGQLQPQWPPITVSATREPDELPQAVVVRRPLGGEVLMWYPFQGDTRRPAPQAMPFGNIP
jgi:general secretion pathway protein J